MNLDWQCLKSDAFDYTVDFVGRWFYYTRIELLNLE